MFSKAFGSLSAAKKIAYLAMFAAISVVVDSIGIDLSASQKLSFTTTVNFLAGGMFGPVGGLTVAVIGDILGCLIKGYAPNILITLSAGLFGLIPGLVMTYMRGKVWIKTIVSFLLCLLVCTAGLNTFATYIYYSSQSVSYWAYMLARLPLQCVVAAANCALSLFLARVINRTRGPFKIS